MQIDLNNLVSITEANQNFSKVACIVDENVLKHILYIDKNLYDVIITHR